MSVCMTPDEAAKKRLCPVAAIIGTTDTATPFCHGPKCGAWRFAADQVYREAVSAEARRTGEKPPFAKAAAMVSGKPVTFGLRGFCGLGGPA